jgi:hypothetical protein
MSEKKLVYSLKNVKKQTSFINSVDTLPIVNLKEERIGVKKSFQFGFEKETSLFTIKVIIEFACRLDTPEPISIFGATVQCDFLFANYDTLLIPGDDRIDIPDELLVTLMSLSYSTARGVLATLTAGTDYQELFLPLVNPADFKKMLKPSEEQSKK